MASCFAFIDQLNREMCTYLPNVILKFVIPSRIPFSDVRKSVVNFRNFPKYQIYSANFGSLHFCQLRNAPDDYQRSSRFFIPFIVIFPRTAALCALKFSVLELQESCSLASIIQSESSSVFQVYYNIALPCNWYIAKYDDYSLWKKL